MAIMAFKVIQGHRGRYQLKARVRLNIILHSMQRGKNGPTSTFSTTYQSFSGGHRLWKGLVELESLYVLMWIW